MTLKSYAIATLLTSEEAVCKQTGRMTTFL